MADGNQDGLEGCQSELAFRPGRRALPQLYLHTPVSPNKDFAFFVHGMDLDILDGGGFAQPMSQELRWKLKAAVQ